MRRLAIIGVVAAVGAIAWSLLAVLDAGSGRTYARPMSNELLALCGLVVGLLVGVVVRKPALGCLIMLAVPAAMIAWVAWWQSQNPDQLRSTSALDFVFAPLWPSLGALAGYIAAQLLRRDRGERP